MLKLWNRGKTQRAPPDHEAAQQRDEAEEAFGGTQHGRAASQLIPGAGRTDSSLGACRGKDEQQPDLVRKV